ncbi:hypothetical protein B0H14DRAFT_3503580 [Mycena olivaceomarginata]|nr:hypothetical protein B0H14DRAFT_3503580 [Mycena olivaceomarginata]
MIHCVPPYYPSLGHESCSCPDNDLMRLYYAVFVEQVRGVYTNSWIVRDQTDRFTDAQHKGFKKWAELEQWWHVQCAAHHHSHQHPSLNAHLQLRPLHLWCLLLQAAPSTVAPACLHPSPFAASPQPKQEEGEPSLKREDTQPSLHLNLTPTGHARGTALVTARATRDASLPASVCPSILVTPAPANAAAERGPCYYGIRGISVFSHTHAAAMAAASSLQMAEPHIMVSRNMEKLEHWMLSEPFKGEDEEA